ncbi:MAG: hypothetical protein LUD81_07195 [Clostridiales bacterium]|nr:hypothetical protein [Clostridiales bacterium]
MADRLVEVIKSVAVDAVKAGRPCEVIFGRVTKDYEEDEELCITLSDKLSDLPESFFIFHSSIAPKLLEKNTVLTVLTIQGGQKYYVIEARG